MTRSILLTLFFCASAAAADDGLLEAARRGDSAAALRLVDAGSDAGAAEPNGTTPLHWAVYNADFPLVERLIRAGADVSASNDYGSSPLSEAAALGRTDIIRALLDAGADPEAANADGQTALMIVARTNNVEAAELLIANGADVNRAEAWRGQTALMWAAAECQPEMIRALAAHGALVNAQSKRNDWPRQVTAEPRAMFRPGGAWSALLYAAREGCVGAAQALIGLGADLDIANEDGMTALLVATMNFHFDVASVLIEAGANVDKWDWRGRSPLYAAVDLNTIPKGGRADLPSNDETTSLELIELLLDSGANPNLRLKLNPLWRATQDDRGTDLLLSPGTTPLLRAAKALDTPAIRLLLAHGADPDLGNTFGITRTQIVGVTPLMAASALGVGARDTRRPDYDAPDIERQAIAAIQALLDGGADINARDTHGRTALHGAAAWGWSEVVRFLAANGADLTAEDADGVTPLDAALGKMEEGRLVNRASVHEDTAAVLQELLEASGAPSPRSTAVPESSR